MADSMSCTPTAQVGPPPLRGIGPWHIQTPSSGIPPGVLTGEYGDRTCGDEMLWASAELWRTTAPRELQTTTSSQHERQYRETLRPTAPPSWPTVAPLGLWTYALDRMAAGDAVQEIRAASIAAADALVARTAAHAYRISMVRSDFVWGSNAVAANYGLQLLVATAIAPKRAYVDAALDNLHYLLGRNTFSLSWVTGVGANPFRHPHHRPSGADAEPPSRGRDCSRADPTDASRIPRCRSCPTCRRQRCISTSRTAMPRTRSRSNWNAPLVFVLAALQ